MHTFKPGMPVTINEGARPSGNYNFDDYKIFKADNKSFTVIGVYGDTITIKGDQTEISRAFNASDLTPKSEEKENGIVQGDRVKVKATGLLGTVKALSSIENATHLVKIEGGFSEWYTESEIELVKSDCIVVTDQKFKEGDRVKRRGYDEIGKVLEVDPEHDTVFIIHCSFPDKTTWFNPDFLEVVDESTSLPFTEELFNQGKYSIHYDDMPVDGFHSFEGMYLGKIGSDWKQLNAERLTLREKEVVRYHVIHPNTGWHNLEDAIIHANELAQENDSAYIVVANNTTTRTVEKVWDFLTDKK